MNAYKPVLFFLLAIASLSSHAAEKWKMQCELPESHAPKKGKRVSLEIVDAFKFKYKLKISGLFKKELEDFEFTLRNRNRPIYKPSPDADAPGCDSSSNSLFRLIANHAHLKASGTLRGHVDSQARHNVYVLPVDMSDKDGTGIRLVLAFEHQPATENLRKKSPDFHAGVAHGNPD